MKYSKAPTISSINSNTPIHTVINVPSQQTQSNQPQQNLLNLPKSGSGNLSDQSSSKLSKSIPNIFSPVNPVIAGSLLLNLDSSESTSTSVDRSNPTNDNKESNLSKPDSFSTSDSQNNGLELNTIPINIKLPESNNNNNNYSQPLYSTSLTSKQTLVSNFVNVEKSNKRKYSDRLNKAANTIVNFGAELSSNTSTVFFSDQSKESMDNLELMSRIVQLCVSDMIKYSIDLFTVCQILLKIKSN